MQASLASVYSRVSQPRHYCYSGLDYLCMRVCVCDGGRQECCPVHYGMFSSIPSLYPLEASSALPTPIGVTSKNISGRFQMFLWGQNHPLVEKQRSRVNKKTIIWGSLNKWKKKKERRKLLKARRPGLFLQSISAKKNSHHHSGHVGSDLDSQGPKPTSCASMLSFSQADG